MSQFARKLARLSLVLTTLVSACRDAGPDPVEACTGSIEVGLRSEPLGFVWSPRCGISHLSVTAVATTPGTQDRLVWAFHVPELSPVGPGIVYGEAPSHATVWAGPEPLAVGGRYRVQVMKFIGGDVVEASGEVTFTWFPPDWAEALGGSRSDSQPARAKQSGLQIAHGHPVVHFDAA